MSKEKRRYVCFGAGLLAMFVLWTAAVCFVDVQAVGPQNSTVGLATLNRFVHEATGVHMGLYHITDWLGLVPLVFMLGFALLGLCQWIGRKQIKRVDRSILVLGGFYAVMMAAYIFFEEVVVNYRPVLIDGILEASYPSSTTVLVLCVMPTAIMQLRGRIKSKAFKGFATYALAAFAAFMVVGRLLSGVHWLTDIIGGILLSMGLVMLYRGCCIHKK